MIEVTGRRERESVKEIGKEGRDKRQLSTPWAQLGHICSFCVPKRIQVVPFVSFANSGTSNTFQTVCVLCEERDTACSTPVGVPALKQSSVEHGTRGLTRKQRGNEREHQLSNTAWHPSTRGDAPSHRITVHPQRGLRASPRSVRVGARSRPRRLSLALTPRCVCV